MAIIIISFLFYLQALFEYSVVGQSASLLSISNNGELFLEDAVDRESTTELEASVQVSDGTLSCPYLATVSISVVDVNDNAPVIQPSSVELTVEENDPDFDLASFVATDADSSPAFSAISHFSIEPFVPGSPVPFEVGADGQLRSLRELDAESDPSTFELYLVAFDRLGLQSEPVNVTLHLENINDHRPVFSQSFYYTAVGEETPALSNVLNVSASDNDIGVYGRITYSFESDEYPFELNTTDGRIFSTRLFDFEQEIIPTFTIPVIATDGGGLTATATVTIEIGDADEFAPQFEQESYTACIAEGTPLGHVVLDLIATDEDSANASLQYVGLGSTEIPFQVLSNGSIVTNYFLSDYETSPTSKTYTFSVLAIDIVGRPSSPSTVEICITNINDHPPYFQPNTLELSVAENSVGLLVMLTAQDPDGTLNQLAFSLATEPDQFRLFTTGELYLEAPLDYEEITVYQIQALVNDSVFTSEALNITVHVTNINDHPPVFTQHSYTAELLESEPADTILAVIQASDGDAQNRPLLSLEPFARVARYEIVEENVPFSIDLDPRTDFGLLKNTREFDFETDSCTYHLTVVAYDGGNASSIVHASVAVILGNINDNPIQFQNDTFYFTVEENFAGVVGSLDIIDPDYASAVNCHLNQSDNVPSAVFSVVGGDADPGTFSINPTGEVTILNQLDYESASSDELVVLVMAMDGFYSAVTELVITLQDVNEFCPELAETSVSLSVPETTAPGSGVYTIVTTDADGSEGATVIYELTDSQSHFLVDQDGVVRANSPLDFEGNQTSYTVSIRVSDGSPLCLGVVLSMQIEVTDENDEPPEFRVKEYRFSASETLQPFSVVGQVSVYDPDLIEFSPLLLTLEPDSVPFILNPSGEILLIQSLNFEDTQFYTFVVSAFDGIHTSSEPANVTIIVENVNEHAPEFTGPFAFTLLENQVDRFLINVLDRDAGRLGEIQRFTINGTDSHLFSIDSEGYLGNVDPLDYEAIAQMFRFTVCAYDSEQLNACESFSVTLRDVNDNSPQFSLASHLAEITEGLPSVQNLVRVVAIDRDSSVIFNTVSYAWDDSSSTLADRFGFVVNQTTGVIHTPRIFDYEADPTMIELTVVASDSEGLNSTASVTITIVDRNEHAPQLEQSRYNVSVSENFPLNAALFTFTATDADGSDQFGQIQSFQVTNLQQQNGETFPFEVNSDGTIVITERLDFESGLIEYAFSLVAVDGGGLRSSPAEVTIHVLDALDSPPVFDPQESMVSVLENSVSGDPLLTLNVITESPFIFLEIDPSTYSSNFDISNSGSLTLLTPLDFETIQEITLQIIAFDGALYSIVPATVRVQVGAQNDNKPVFDQQRLTASLAENLLQNTLQVSLRATDDDLDTPDSSLPPPHGRIVEYRILNRSVPFMLVYDQLQATASLTNTRPLDAEVDPEQYTLVVQAYDGGRMEADEPAVVVISVEDIDDNTPAFEQPSYTAGFNENSAGVILSVSATDSDRDADLSRIRFSLINSQSPSFSILANGSIINALPFDFETDDTQYAFSVQILGCTQPLCTASVELTLQDENDHTPVFEFEEYTYRLPNDVFPSIGSMIGQVVATDDDKSSSFGEIVKYQVVGNSGPFSVHSASGQVVVGNPASLREGERTVQFEVEASDGGGQSSKTVVQVFIPVFNLYAPIFEQRFYYVTWEENAFNFRLPGLPVNALLQVRAQDLDRPYSQITYHLIGQSENFDLTIDGFLVLKAPLDWEDSSEHTLSARAFDGNYNSTFDTDIRVVVINQNDNPPVFNQLFYEVNVSEHHLALSTPIARLLASDIDSDQIQLSYTILEPNAPFRVDFAGNVFLLTQLDYEVTTEYQFSVSVSDGFFQSQSPARIDIHLEDENDHYPFFSQPVYQANIVENTVPGSLRLPIAATDFDASAAYGEIARYSILETSVPFEVRYNFLGEPYVTNTQSLDYEVDQHLYVFHVHAYDRGTLRSFYPAQVVITLMDSDDCPPVFSQTVYSASVAENNPVPVFIAKVSATDCDVSPRFRRVDFSLLNPILGLISIHPVSGTIMGLRLFDFETAPSSYQFEIVARSATDFSHFDTATLNLTVIDSNEFAPEFTNLPYHVSIPESTAIGQTVLTLTAIDRDAGDIYGSIQQYTIAQQHTTGLRLPFSLNSSTGDLVLTRTLDYDGEYVSFRIPVAAVDGGLLLSRTIVEIRVTNVNDEPPFFVVSEYRATVKENAFNFQLKGLPRNCLLQLQASDGDSHNSLLIFSVASFSSVFRIDSNGYLYLEEPLDFEEGSTYDIQVSLSDGVFTSNQSATVTVEVTNINDQMPVFYACLNGCCGGAVLSTPLTLAVDENVIPDASLMTTTACDGDGDEMEYFLKAATIDDNTTPFQIRDGQLFLVSPLDYEETSQYQFQVVASDGTYNSSNAVQVVVVTQNLDDNILNFGNSSYEGSIDENSALGSLSIPILARDTDEPLADIEYAIESNSQEVPFRVVQEVSGINVLTNSEIFDFESSKEWYLFNITARGTNSALVQEVAKTSVKVLIRDTNEFAPEFPTQLYNVSVAENVIGTIANVSAIDRDGSELYGKVSYTILHEPEIPCIITDEGEIINMEPFDAERGPSVLDMVVEAEDGGNLKATTVVRVSIIDENDNKPYFTSRNYYVAVPENTTVGDSVLTLQASDYDVSELYSTITDYVVVDGPQVLPFNIETSGAVRLSSPLDYELGLRTFTFTVAAVDSGALRSEAVARVTIEVLNVPDQPPTFSQATYSASVFENSALGAVVMYIQAQSREGGHVLCSILPALDTLPFEIGAESGIVFVNGTVDFESVQMYRFQVLCYLSTKPEASSAVAATIHVMNINDNPPVMEQSSYYTTVLENSQRGSMELMVKATDLDRGNAGLIREFQLYSNYAGFFIRDFDQNAGTAVVSNLEPFDYELVQSIELSVRAIDRGSPQSISEPATITVVILDQNDNAPRFTRDFYSVAVTENQAGTILTVEATDDDSGNFSGQIVRYEIEPATAPFIVSTDGAVIAMQALDYESFSDFQLPRYQFSVTAYDSLGLASEPAVVLITVLNENDNSPVPLGAWPVMLVEIEWSTPVSSRPVFTLSAADADKQDRLYYYVEGLSIELPFALPHLRNGEVILRHPLTELKTYNFTVAVQDRHPLFMLLETRSIQWEISVSVVDTNTRPFFSMDQLIQIITVPESAEISSTPLLQVVAEDNDFPGSLFATITQYILQPLILGPVIPANASFPFQITSTGEIIQTGPLNAGIASQYIFSIVAVDGGGLMSVDSIAVTVIVEEKNDFAPEFAGGPFEILVLDDTPPNAVVLMLNVSDADEGVSGIVSCSFEEAHELFTIDPNSCTVYLTTELTDMGLEGAKVTLQVTATDEGAPPLSTTVEVDITIVPATIQKLELFVHNTSFAFIEEGNPVHLLQNLTFVEGSLASSQYTANVHFLPSPVPFNPDSFTAHCLPNGRKVDILQCFPDSTDLLFLASRDYQPVDITTRGTASPISVLTGGLDVFVFQTWLKTSLNNTRTLLAGYSSSFNRDDPVFLITLGLHSTALTFTSGSSEQVFTFEFPDTLMANQWHHFVLQITSEAIQVYIDGQVSGTATLASQNGLQIPNSIYLYTGSTKRNEFLPFSGLLWGATITFGPQQRDITSSISCIQSCGEILSTDAPHSNVDISTSSYEINFAATDFEDLVSALSGLFYNNIASEPSPHEKALSVVISDGLSQTNQTLILDVQLLNDHMATVSLNMRRGIYYYVGLRSEPHAIPLSANALFSDEDTTQTDYRIQITLNPPSLRSWDRLDYPVKVKLEQCNTDLDTVFNLLPNMQWGVAKMQNVELYYSTVVGYRFYGGYFIPDMTIYDSVDFTPARFTVMFWVQYSAEGTVLSIRNDTERFHFNLRVNETSIAIEYSTAATSKQNLAWYWSPVEDWTHIAVAVNNQTIELCINGHMCSSQSIPPVVTTLNSFTGVEAFVGTLPGTGAQSLRYQDQFTGALSGMALIPDFALPLDVLTCAVASSERITLDMPVEAIGGVSVLPLTAPTSTGYSAVNGSLFINEPLRQDQVQEVLRHVAYINTHPYPLAVTRSISYTIHDESVEVQPASSANVIVLYHGQRSLQLLRTQRTQFLTNAQLVAGAQPFMTTGITTDVKRDTLDSLFVELASSPQSGTSCYNDLETNPQSANNCPSLFSIDPQLLSGTRLQTIRKPNKLIIHGLGSVSLYQNLLQEIVIQTDDPSEVLNSASSVSVRIYVSDMNGIASDTRTLAVSVSQTRRRRQSRSKRRVQTLTHYGV